MIKFFVLNLLTTFLIYMTPPSCLFFSSSPCPITYPFGNTLHTFEYSWFSNLEVVFELIKIRTGIYELVYKLTRYIILMDFNKKITWCIKISS